MRWRTCIVVAAVMGLGASCTPPDGTSDTSSTRTMVDSGGVATSTSALAPSTDVGAIIAGIFGSVDDSTKAALAESLEGEVATDALTDLLHDNVPFASIGPGRSRIAAPIGFTFHREVVVRTPRGYDPTRPWPLIVAYHTWGGTGDAIIDRLELLLGGEVENFVIAAPNDYRQTIIDAPPPITSEHISVWLAIRSRWHIDADRMYLAGYSLGGETVVTLSAMHPGQVAAAIPMAAGFSFPSDVEGMWEAFLSNMSTVAVLHTWGAEDTLNIPGLNGRPQSITLAQQNERLDPMLDLFGMDRYTHIRLEDVGHADAYPSRNELLGALATKRSPLPKHFVHHFRWIHQADAFWVEGHEWLGDGWFAPWPEVSDEPGETDEEALARTLFSLMGSIEADIDGQNISVETTHLADLTVWISDGMIEWDEPITVTVNGTEVFRGAVRPRTAVALTQAERTRDFDRLRLAGVRIAVESGLAHLVSPDEVFPDLVRGITF